MNKPDIPLTHKQRFVGLLKTLVLTVPQFSQCMKEPGAIDAWYDVFSQTPINTVHAAFKKAQVECKIFPSIAELKKFCDESSDKLPADPFEKILRLSKNSKNIPLDTHRALLEAAELMGRFETIGSWDTSKMHFQRKAFDENIWPRVVSKILLNEPLLIEEKKKAPEALRIAGLPKDQGSVVDMRLQQVTTIGGMKKVLAAMLKENERAKDEQKRLAKLANRPPVAR